MEPEHSDAQIIKTLKTGKKAARTKLTRLGICWLDEPFMHLHEDMNEYIHGEWNSIYTEGTEMSLTPLSFSIF